jgi:hypothetical protein
MTIFRKIDVNGNGEISPSEFIKALRKDEGLANGLGLPNKIRQEDESRNFFAYAFAEIDTDDSKSISMEEFLAYYTGEGGTAEGEIMKGTKTEKVKIKVHKNVHQNDNMDDTVAAINEDLELSLQRVRDLGEHLREGSKVLEDVSSKIAAQIVLQSDDSVLQQVNQSLHRSFDSCQTPSRVMHTFGTSPLPRPELSESSSIGSNLSLAYLWSPWQEPFERGSDHGMPAIAAILPGGPADECNDIKLLGRIISIDGIDTFGKQMEQLSPFFLGRANTNVSLVIRSVSGEKTCVCVQRRAVTQRSRDLCTAEFTEHSGAHTQQHWQIGFDSGKHLDPETEMDSFKSRAVLSHLCRWLRSRLQKALMSSIIHSWAYYVKRNMKNARMLASAVNRNNLMIMMLSFDTLHDIVHSNIAKVDQNVVRTVLLNRKSSCNLAAKTDDEKTGIGIVFGRSVVGRDPYTIQKVLTDGTAYQSGMIKAGDWLHEVNGVKVVDLTVDQIKSLIMGKPCSPITVTISFFERGLAAPRLPPSRSISRGARENDRPWISGALVDTGDDHSNMNGAGKSVDRVGATTLIPSDQQYSIASTASASWTKEQQESRCPKYPLDRQSPELTCLSFENFKPPHTATHGIPDRTLTQEEISFQHDEKKMHGFHENKTPCVKTQFSNKKRTTGVLLTPETDVSIAVTEPRRLATGPGKVTAVAAKDEFNTGNCPRRNLWGGHQSPSGPASGAISGIFSSPVPLTQNRSVCSL